MKDELQKKEVKKIQCCAFPQIKSYFSGESSDKKIYVNQAKLEDQQSHTPSPLIQWKEWGGKKKKGERGRGRERKWTMIGTTFFLKIESLVGFANTVHTIRFLTC